jgi:hypothetical protein
MLILKTELKKLPFLGFIRTKKHWISQNIVIEMEFKIMVLKLIDI